MDDVHSAPQDPADAPAPDAAPADAPPVPVPDLGPSPAGRSTGPLPPLDIAERVRAGIAALRNGDRPGAHAIFRAAVDAAPRNEHAWIGLALAGSTVEEAAGALQTAEEINPASRFVAQAEGDLGRRWPGFAEALAAARAAHPAAAPVPLDPVAGAAAAAEPPLAAAAEPALALAPRLGSGGALAPQGDSRARRGLLSAAVLLLGVALVAILGVALASSNLFSPPLPTATPLPPSVTPLPPSATPLPPLPAPVIHLPPTLTAAPAGSATGARDLGPGGSPAGTPGQADIERQAAFDAVRAGRYADAIPALEAASERTPGDIEALYYLGLAYLSAPARPHGTEDAELTFRSILAARPHWAPGLDMLARSLIAQGRFADAVPPAYEAVQLDHRRAEYYITLGRAYEGGGDAADAAKAYGAADRLSPTTPGPTPSVPPGAPVTPTLTLLPATAVAPPPTLPANAPATGTLTVPAGAPVTGTLTLPAGAPVTGTLTVPAGATAAPSPSP